MADIGHLAFTIAGPDAGPANIRLRDLLALLAELEIAITATARHMGASEDHSVLSLSDIRRGSAVYELAASGPAQQAAERISHAINRRNSEYLPQQAADSLMEIHRRSVRMGMAFVLNNGQFKSTIEPSIPLFSDALIHGATSVFGYLNAIGGTRPTAKIKLSEGKQITAEVLNQELAQQLGQHLYHFIELHGDAWWHAATMDLRRFRIRRIGTYDDAISVSQAFAELAAVSPGTWDSVDPADYINEQRSELP